MIIIMSSRKMKKKMRSWVGITKSKLRARKTIIFTVSITMN